jgi:hypothetical protein
MPGFNLPYMAEAPAALSPPAHYTITRDGGAFGPYTLEEIKAYLATGQILLTDQAWPNGAPPPTTVGALMSPTGQGDVTGGVIPYKNPPALASYYVGLASVIPVLGILAGIVAVVLGILGLKRYHAEPWRRGRIHSYVGIALGLVGAMTWSVLLLFFAVPLLSRLHH